MAQDLLPNTLYDLSEQLNTEKKEGRYKLYERSKNPVSFKVQEKDVELLQGLEEYRFLDLDDIQILFPRQHLPTTSAKNQKRSWQRRLGLLFDDGFVTRPPRQTNNLKPRKATVYGLGNEGATLLAQRRGVDRDDINWQRRNREVKLPTIEHQLLIGRLRATLTLATNDTEKANLYRWEPENEVLYQNWREGGKKLKIRPDSFIVLELTGQKEPFRNYLLEADRSNESHKVFFEKLVAYWKGQRQYKEKLGINRFRVLTLTISRERRDNLLEKTRELEGIQRRSTMFLFASESCGDSPRKCDSCKAGGTCEEGFSMTDPSSILKPIWRCPADDNWHTLLE